MDQRRSVDWLSLLRMSVAVMLPGLGFLAALTLDNAREISRMQGADQVNQQFLETTLEDIKARLAAIEEAVRK